MLTIKRLKAEQVKLVTPIRDVGRVDEETVLTVSRSGFLLSYKPKSEGMWRSFPPPAYADAAFVAQDPYSAFFAALEDGKYIGCGAVTACDNGWAEILDLRVDSAFRRQGVGRMLIRSCRVFARQADMHGLRAVCSDQNPVFCHFITDLGFTLQGLDRMALAATKEELAKPVAHRACQLTFYSPLGRSEDETSD